MQPVRLLFVSQQSQPTASMSQAELNPSLSPSGPGRLLELVDEPVPFHLQHHALRDLEAQIEAFQGPEIRLDRVDGYNIGASQVVLNASGSPTADFLFFAPYQGHFLPAYNERRLVCKWPTLG
ncbi:hypothetical protein B7463_g9878, partial [Scytalidium lignicola]